MPANYTGPLGREAGIVFVPVEHEGNTQASDEEVEVIVSLVQDMLGRNFTAKDGKIREIDWQNMLFVAPYTFQVSKLKVALAVFQGGGGGPGRQCG